MKTLLKINLSQEKLGWSSENSLWNGYNHSGHLLAISDIVFIVDFEYIHTLL